MCRHQIYAGHVYTMLVMIQLEDLNGGTYGLGMAAKSSKEDVSGTCARTDGE